MEIDELAEQARIDQLPFEIRWPTERGLTLWREGQLDAAKASLDIALATANDLGNPFGVFHALHLRASVAFSERDYALARHLHREVLGLCHEIDFVGGMGSALCDLAMIDLIEGDVDGAWVRYERGLACLEDGGYADRAADARALWERAAQAS